MCDVPGDKQDRQERDRADSKGGFFSSSVHDGEVAVAVARAMAQKPAAETQNEPAEEYRHRVDPREQFLRK
jgi:hypothetical protein